MHLILCPQTSPLPWLWPQVVLHSPNNRLLYRQRALPYPQPSTVIHILVNLSMIFPCAESVNNKQPFLLLTSDSTFLGFLIDHGLILITPVPRYLILKVLSQIYSLTRQVCLILVHQAVNLWFNIAISVFRL